MPLPSVAQLTKALALAQKIEEAESALASIMSSSVDAPITKKRGRPPGRPAAKKRAMSEEGRKRIAEAQKKRWAAQKAEERK